MLVVVAREFPDYLIKKMVEFFPGEIEWEFTDDKQFKRIEDADIIFTYHFSSSDLRRAKNLKWLQISSSGYEHLPLSEINDRNVILTNIHGVSEKMMAEYVIFSILYFSKKMFIHLRSNRKHVWNKVLGSELCGKKVLILGTGNVGSEVAKLVSQFNMEAYGVNRSGVCPKSFKAVYLLDEVLSVLPSIDFVVNTLPLTEDTKNIVNEKFLDSMNPLSYFILIGRAGTVDEDALFKSLKTNKIAGGAIDVFWEEPLPQDSRWYRLDNVLITPHVAGVGENYDEKITEVFLNNLNKFIKKESLEYQIN